MKAINLIYFAALVCGAVGIIQTEPNGPLHRAKRFARNPLTYMNKINPSQVELEAPLANIGSGYYTKRFLLGRDAGDGLTPVKSHFREFHVAQDPSGQTGNDDALFLDAPPAVLPPRAIRRYMTTSNKHEMDMSPATIEELANRMTPMSEDELRAWILLLDGYALSSGSKPDSTRNSESYRMPAVAMQSYNPSYLNPEDLRRAARMYALGKRENAPASGRFFDLEQPESLDNDAEERLQFFTPKRSKRVGGPVASTDSGRIKKETDAGTQADQGFSGPRALPLSASESVAKSAATGGSTHAALGSPTTKKSIDWSYYFGIDKKDDKAPRQAHEPAHLHAQETPGLSTVHPALESTTGGATDPKPPKALVAVRITEPSKSSVKESKEQKKLRMREENETENKSDRKWYLNEFYKNLAMATNVRRKREISKDNTDDLVELEQKMEAAGDDIIWKTLKYAGAHKDEPMTPQELAQVKKDIIGKLAAAYNLEKIREAIETFREQLLAIKTNNIEE